MSQRLVNSYLPIHSIRGLVNDVKMDSTFLDQPKKVLVSFLQLLLVVAEWKHPVYDAWIDGDDEDRNVGAIVQNKVGVCPWLFQDSWVCKQNHDWRSKEVEEEENQQDWEGKEWREDAHLLSKVLRSESAMLKFLERMVHKFIAHETFCKR